MLKFKINGGEIANPLGVAIEAMVGVEYELTNSSAQEKVRKGTKGDALPLTLTQAAGNNSFLWALSQQKKAFGLVYEDPNKNFTITLDGLLVTHHFLDLKSNPVQFKIILDTESEPVYDFGDTDTNKDLPYKEK
ncbi:hypothetical protein FACS18942_09610 [Planctomycetales bacterium]|nr:hypothetical protein FACS18942_09610 [Planctomycetales bacterium]